MCQKITDIQTRYLGHGLAIREAAWRKGVRGVPYEVWPKNQMQKGADPLFEDAPWREG